MWFRSRPLRPEQFEEVLARCLAAIEDDGATVESCLATYPRHADRLAPALRIATGVRGRLAVTPDPAFVQRTRARVLAAARPAPVAPVAAPSRVPAWRTLWRPMATAAAAVVLVALLLMPLAAVTSADALPGDWNYGIKLAKEHVELALGFSDHLDIADERAKEIKQLAVDGKLEQIPEVTRAYQAELFKATGLLQQAALPQAKAKEIDQRVTSQETVLKSAQEAVREKTQPSQPPSPPPGQPEPSATATPGAASSPSAAPPPVVAQAQPAIQSALSTATEVRQQAAAVVQLAQTRSTPPPTPTPASTAAAQRTPAAAAGTGTPAVAGTTITPGPIDSPGGTASAATATPATPSGTAEIPPAVTRSPAPAVVPAETATPRPTTTAVPSTAATQPSTPRPAIAATPTASAPPVATRTPTPPASAATVTPTEAPRRSGTPEPAPSPAVVDTPASRPTPTAPPVPQPANSAPRPTATPIRVPMIDLGPGQVMLLYNGPTLPVDQALAAFAGHYTAVEWSPSGSPLRIRYTPGARADQSSLLTTQSILTIQLTDTVRVIQGFFIPLEP